MTSFNIPKIIWTDLGDKYKSLSGEESEASFDAEANPMAELSKNQIMTPFGAFDKRDALNPMELYSFKMGDTNFMMTPLISQLLGGGLIEGIEVFRPLSQYKFIVAEGKMFSWTSVRNQIERFALNKGLFNRLPVSSHDLEEICNSIIQLNIEEYKSDKKEHTCMLINPDLSYEIKNDQAGFEELNNVNKELPNSIFVHSDKVYYNEGVS